MKKLLLLFTIQIFLLANIGEVSAIKGDAIAIRDSKEIKLERGSQLDKGDTLITKNGKMQIVFIDNTVITIGKNSTFNISEYNFDKEGKSGNLKVDFKNGVFKSITGQIGKISPEKFQLTTKTSTIGIRGTTVFVNSQPKAPDIIACIAGKIEVTSITTNVSVPVLAGRITTVAPNEAPKPPRVFQPNEVEVFAEQESTTQSETKETKETEEKSENKEQKQTQTQKVDEKALNESIKQADTNQEQLVESREIHEVVEPLIDTTQIQETINQNVQNAIENEIQQSIDPTSNIPALPEL